MVRPDVVRLLSSPLCSLWWWRCLLLGLLGVSFAPVLWASNWTISPGIRVQEVWSDNVSLAAAGQQRNEFVTQITPNINIVGSGARLRVNVAATWDYMKYASQTSADRTVTSLSSSGTLELLKGSLFVDASASISRQVLSPLGASSVQATNISGNTTRTQYYSLSPYVKGNLGADWFYNVRLSATSTTSSSDSTGSTVSTAQGEVWNGSLRWRDSRQLFNFDTAFSASKNWSGGASPSTSKTARFFANYNPYTNLTFSYDIGYEASAGSSGQISSTFRGLGLRWQPSSLTDLTARREFRYFGPADTLSFNHRFRRSALTLSYTRDRQSYQDVLANSTSSSYYQLYSSMLSVAIPDPVQRDLQVRQLLFAQGLSPDAIPSVGFVSDRVMIRQVLNAALAMSGSRNTLSIMLNRSSTTSDAWTSGVTLLDTFTRVGQTALTLSWSHQMSGQSSLMASASYSRSETEDSGGNLGNSTQMSYVLFWNKIITQRMSGALSLRHVESSSSAGGGNYQENSATASIGYKY